jgi:hypothetical protein
VTDLARRKTVDSLAHKQVSLLKNQMGGEKTALLGESSAVFLILSEGL